MSRSSGYGFSLLLLSTISLYTAGVLSAVSDRNSTENGTVADGGFVPLVFSKVSQIIAREGNCALIDCNVTGEPVPNIQWFNSHGDLLDTETSRSFGNRTFSRFAPRLWNSLPLATRDSPFITIFVPPIAPPL
ncbi:unnamed protein product [Oncorhynchus mykiss]|uniref:Ig-like domain-containing protein n=1 Tax=Oncorhynchus mykiss TaxID=8022 RepID=A0A060X0W0_ONCMY|nr:unnamed protein product [Oncorhynchus mykiss]